MKSSGKTSLKEDGSLKLTVKTFTNNTVAVLSTADFKFLLQLDK